MTNNKNFKISFNLAELLTLLFIALKLTRVVDWSWWWVLSPLWIPFGIFAVVMIICMVLAMIFTRK